ncbi:tyrosine-type recombinase/integrase [Bradyrhizobium japonicum]|uniref:tyrosine-type recombinase/integrase n=1 Tax=Bradyrhizobium japonicum TaxID=375 RepID=UPI000576DE07|nr:tyrosine-type recombinase/integrase [Bradyrhizobium japonicum]
MPSLSLPYLTTTKTGICGYRRRVPDGIRDAVGKTEIVKSFESSDAKVVKLRHAEFHAGVERMFAQAKTSAGISSDLVFEAAVRSLTARGLPSGDANDKWSAADRSDAVDIVLADAGMRSLDELEEALEVAANGEQAKLRKVSTEIAIVQGTLSRPKPKLTYCLRLLLEDRARGRDTQREDWVRYERERKRIVSELIRKIGDKDITTVSRADARSFLTHLEKDRYSAGSVKKQIAFMKAMFDFGFHEFEHSGVNPWGKLKVVVAEDDDESGVSFDYAEVRTLLSKVAAINDDLQDIIRLLACTGARLGEICGLELGDVDLTANTISLRYNSIRRLKNKKSVRVVPVVDDRALAALGARIRRFEAAGRHAPVFPRYGRRNGSASASAALGKWLTKIKLRDPKAEKPKTTHSLRHTFKDALRELGVHRDLANMLQGHTAGDVASDYGSSELIDAKRDAAQKAWLLIFG